MARVTGLEPATSGVTGRHSNQLSYTRALDTEMSRSADLGDRRDCVKENWNLKRKWVHTEISK